MIEITKDKKGDSFIITKTQKIAGINFHKQINLSPEEMNDLYMWFFHHFIRIEPCTSLEEAILRLGMRRDFDKKNKSI